MLIANVLFFPKLTGHVTGEAVRARASYNSVTQTYTANTACSDYDDRGPALLHMELYHFNAMYHKVKEQLSVQPEHYRNVTFTSYHKQYLTHSLQLHKEDHYTTPLLLGKRCPAVKHLLVGGDAALARYYRLYVLTLLCPWSRGAPLFAAGVDVTDLMVKQRYDAFVNAGIPPHCSITIAEFESYYDQQAAAMRMREKERCSHGEAHIDDDSDEEQGAGACAGNADSDVDQPLGGHIRARPTLTAGCSRALELFSKSVSAMPTNNVRIPTDLAAMNASLQPALNASPAVIKSWSKPSTSTVATAAGEGTGIPEFPARIVIVESVIKSLIDGNTTPIGAPATDPLPQYASVQAALEKFKMVGDERQTNVFLFGVAAIMSKFLQGDVSALTPAQHTSLRATLASLAEFRPTQALHLTGAGGCGKSNVINALLAFATAYNMRHAVRTAGPTGFSAQNIGGTTIHNLGGIPMFFNYNTSDSLPNGLAEKINTYAHLGLIILDEVSMMDAQMFGLLSKTIAFQVGNQSLPFGGVPIIIAADFYQLHSFGAAAQLFETDRLTSADLNTNKWEQMGLLLWVNEEFMGTCVELINNYRAEKPWADLLLRVRHSEATADDLAVLKRCIVSAPRPLPPDTMVLAFENKECALVIQHFAPLNAKVHNRKVFAIRPEVLDDSDNIVPYDNSHSVFLGGKSNSTRPLGVIPMYLGQKVQMQMGNGDYELGLVNSIEGTLVGSLPDLPWTDPAGPMVELAVQPTVLFFKIPNMKAGYATIPNGIFPVLTSTLRKQKLPGLAGRYSVRYFPFRSSESGTLWKVQGASLDRVACSTFRGGVENATYVAISRTRNAESLYIMPRTKITQDTINGTMKDGSRKNLQLEADVARLKRLSPKWKDA